MSLPELLDVPITVKVPTDPGTSPEVIWKRQKKEVAHMLRHDFDEATISMTLTLPLWSVRRAICEITTSKPWNFPTLKEMMAKCRGRDNGHRKNRPLPIKENPCPKNKPSQKSPESPEKLPRKRKRGRPRKNACVTTVAGIGTLRKASRAIGTK